MFVGEDSLYAVQMNRFFLRLIGVWPLAPDAHPVVRLLQKVSVVASYFLMSCLLFPCALHAILEEPNPALKIKLIGPIIFNTMAVAKYSCLLNGIKEIDECFRHVEEDWKFHKGRQDAVAGSVLEMNFFFNLLVYLLMTSFSSVMKTAWTYFNILRALML